MCKGKVWFLEEQGGPGCGKGTQCEKIVETFGFTHLSAGDLLRKEISSNSENGAMILDIIKNGNIVPSEVTVKLIQRAIESSENYKFLIDGFPRSDENRIAFERIMGMEPEVVLFFDCPEKEMVKRVLSRNQGRIDDNIDTVKKRLEVFARLNLPVINYYAEKGKLHKINAVGDVDEIFEKVRPIFAAYKDIASDGCFSLGMVAHFEPTFREKDAWMYPRLFWESGILGQVLYLEAHAVGISATGIGCYFDDAVHDVLGLTGSEFQSLYHFTLGSPVVDKRIMSLPAYPGPNIDA
ncbi:UMP-CMP kinase-like isoform X3 [Magnolia sinica]|uniref:UMP-CMP kinase-like isoform X3 n=1 Tax=Magnolia sinica TaxID=86752 RepID=UPI0026588E82|nr:UMP-CMP kinase-like isoform X3 [Magnolia sinica]